MKKHLFHTTKASILLLTLPSIGQAHAQAIIPGFDEIIHTSNEYILRFSLQNNFNLNFTFGSFSHFSTLAPSIYNLGNSNAASVGEMISNEWTIAILPDGVSDGWTLASNSNFGIIGLTQEPGGDLWNNTPGSDTMFFEVRIPTSLLEQNGIPGYQWDGDPSNPANDFSIALSPDEISFFARGGELDMLVQASGTPYVLIGTPIPEPSYTTLTMLVMSAFVLRRRRRGAVG